MLIGIARPGPNLRLRQWHRGLDLQTLCASEIDTVHEYCTVMIAKLSSDPQSSWLRQQPPKAELKRQTLRAATVEPTLNQMSYHPAPLGDSDCEGASVLAYRLYKYGNLKSGTTGRITVTQPTVNITAGMHRTRLNRGGVLEFELLHI